MSYFYFLFISDMRYLHILSQSGAQLVAVELRNRALGCFNGVSHFDFTPQGWKSTHHTVSHACHIFGSTYSPSFTFMVPYSTMLFRLHHLLLALSLVILNLSLDSFLNACVDILNFLHFASIDQTVHFLKEICPSFYALSIFNNLYDSKPLISRLNLLKYLQVYC